MSQGRTPKSEVEVVGGLNVHLTQAMSHYQREERLNVSCVGRQAISPEAAPTVRHLGDGIETKQIPKGREKALPLQGQRVPNLR